MYKEQLKMKIIDKAVKNHHTSKVTMKRVLSAAKKNTQIQC